MGPKPVTAHLRFSFLMPTYRTPQRFLCEAIESVLRQTSGNWELCICDDKSEDPELVRTLQAYAAQDARIRIAVSDVKLGISGASNRAAGLATGDFIAFLDHDDTIEPDTVELLTAAVAADPQTEVIYTDEVKTTSDGVVIGDYLKPDFSPDFLTATMYVGHLLAVRRSLFDDVGGLRSAFDGSQDYDLALRVCTPGRTIAHVRRPLYRWRASAASTALDMAAKPWAVKSARRAIDDFAARLAWPARVDDGLLPGTFRLRPAVVGQPKVSVVVVATGAEDKRVADGGALPLPVNCIEYLASKTNGIGFDVSVADPNTVTDKVAAWLAAKTIPRHKTDDGRSGVVGPLNAAIESSASDIIVVLKDSIEFLTEDWLVALVEYAQLPEIGVVGPRISYEDGSIRHAGLVADDKAGFRRVFEHSPADVMEYQGFAHVVRNVSAVSWDCMVFRKAVWERLGRFDEAFVDGCFDVDFCLKAIESGLRVVYTPFCHLRFLGEPRPDAPTLGDTMLLQSRHPGARNDPYHNTEIRDDWAPTPDDAR